MSFIQRWSRRKHESTAPSPSSLANEGPAVAEGEAAEQTPATTSRAAALIPGYDPERPLDEQLPDPETLNAGDDFRAFLLPGVGDSLKRRALRRMFKVGNYNVRDGLDDYDDDYAALARVAPDASEHIRRWLRAEPEAPTEPVTADTAPEQDTDSAAEDDGQTTTSENVTQHEEASAPNDPHRPPDAST